MAARVLHDSGEGGEEKAPMVIVGSDTIVDVRHALCIRFPRGFQLLRIAGVEGGRNSETNYEYQVLSSHVHANA